jgi:uncharacterized protein (TIGR02246 family)
MKALNPTDNHRIFQDYLIAHDVDGLMSRYREEAVFIGPGRVHLKGAKSIRQVMEQMVPTVISVEFTLVDLVQVGDVAYERLTSKAVMRMPDGGEETLAGSSFVVLQREADGNWLIAIDDLDQ